LVSRCGHFDGHYTVVLPTMIKLSVFRRWYKHYVFWTMYYDIHV